jgi:hypothetical protein
MRELTSEQKYYANILTEYYNDIMGTSMANYWINSVKPEWYKQELVVALGHEVNNQTTIWFNKYKWLTKVI